MRMFQRSIAFRRPRVHETSQLLVMRHTKPPGIPRSDFDLNVEEHSPKASVYDNYTYVPRVRVKLPRVP